MSQSSADYTPTDEARRAREVLQQYRGEQLHGVKRPQKLKDYPKLFQDAEALYRAGLTAANEKAHIRLADKIAGQGPATVKGAERSTKHVKPRLTVNLARMTVTLDRRPWEVVSEQALRWIKVLADHPGEWISSPELPGYDIDLQYPRPDRLKHFLPVRVRILISTNRRKGSRFRSI
jgi:hypothetical protein